MKIREFGGKDDIKFWKGKPLQDGHPDLQMPLAGEQWEIEYGLNKKNKLIINVISDKFPDIKNWRCCNFDCTYTDSNITVTVSGCCFTHRIR